MAIADTIQSMYENVGEVYDTITNVDLPTNKNIQNIPSTMRSSYLEIMNNGIDTIWNNWEKVEGTGESLSLNNTEEAPMKIDLKGNTSQGENPTPTYPQDIHVVSGDNSIEVCGKNILSMEDSTRTYSGGISVTTTNNTSIVFNGIAGTTYYSSNTLNYDLQPGTYTISGTNNNQKYYFWFRDSSNNTISNIHIIGTTSTTFTHSLKTTKIVVGIEGLTAGTSYNETTNIQIEKGTTATEYEEYKGASYPINLGSIELCKIGDYQDSIVKDNGKWYLNKQIGKVVLNGSENWAKGSSRPFYTLLINDILRLQSASNNATLLCNYLSPSTPATIWGNNINGITNLDDGNAIRIRIQDDPYTITTFKEWLDDVKPVVYYVLATPTYTEITDTTLLSQLEALNGARSYNPQTNVSQENNDLPFILDATALKQLTQ